MLEELRKAIAFNKDPDAAPVKRNTKPRFRTKRKPERDESNLSRYKHQKSVEVGHPVIRNITVFRNTPEGEHPVVLHSHNSISSRGFQAKFNWIKLSIKLKAQGYSLHQGFKEVKGKVIVIHDKLPGLYHISHNENIVGRINVYPAQDNSFHIGLAKEHAVQLAGLIFGSDTPPVTTVRSTVSKIRKTR